MWRWLAGILAALRRRLEALAGRPRSPWVLATILLAAAVLLMMWGGGKGQRASFWVNVLAWVVTLFVTLAIGTVAVPAYRARRRSAARRAALTTQHLLLVRLAAHLADEINTRYDLDRFVLYAIPPQGGPVTYSDVMHYHRQSTLVAEDLRSEPWKRLVHQAQQAERRVASFDGLGGFGADPRRYWLAEALVHLGRCPVRERFPLLETLDAARLDRLRDLASGEDPIEAARGTVAATIDEIVAARDRVLSTNLADRRWLATEFAPWLADANGAPLPGEFGAWMDELAGIASLAREMARLLLLVAERAESDVKHAVTSGDELPARSRMVLAAAPGEVPAEDGLEGHLALSPGSFLPTDVPAALEKAAEALAAGDGDRARKWAVRAAAAQEAGALQFLADLDFRAGRHDEAMTWLLEASCQGDPAAARRVGQRLEHKFPREALRWFGVAADRGDAEACWVAAQLERRAGRDEQAHAWVERGAAAGVVPCMLELARATAERDPLRARELARSAARAGSVDAVALLIVLLASSHSPDEHAEVDYWRRALQDLQRHPLKAGETLLVPPGRLTEHSRVMRGWIEDATNPLMAELLRRAGRGDFDEPGPHRSGR